MNEWRVDADGRRYREVSPGCIEYAPDFIFAHGTAKVPRRMVEEAPARLCPFKETQYKRHSCRREACAWWTDKCMIVSGKKAVKLGASCPLSANGRKCVSECAMYGSDGFCALIRRAGDV